MAESIDLRLKAFDALLARTRTLAGNDLDRPVNLTDLTAAGPADAGRTELRDAFVRQNRPLPPPSVGQLVQYAELLRRGMGDLENLSNRIVETGGVHPSDEALLKDGIRPRSLSAQEATPDVRLDVAKQILTIVHSALRIRAGDPADAFAGGS